MSHSIIIQFDNKQMHIENCSSLIDQTKQMLSRTQDTKMINEVQILQDEANELIKQMQEKDKFLSTEHMTILRRISKLEKEVANTFAFMKNELANKFFSNLANANSFNLIEQIKRHGILANEVVKYLSDNQIAINNDNFNQYIQVVESQKLAEDTIKKYINQSYDYIDSTNLDSNLKFELKKQIKNTKDLNILKDMNAIIKSKEVEYQNVTRLAKDVINQLVKQNFMLDSAFKPQYNIDENQNIVLKLAMINSKKNSVKMIFDSTMHLKYKLGNYIGHACELTTKKLLDDLDSMNYKTNIVSIKRDYEEPKNGYAQIDNLKKGSK